MPAADPDPVTTMVRANDKLLKALIALLAIKDEHLLDEMRAVLFVARRDDSPIGDADAATWAHIRKELSLITDLIGSEDAAAGAANARRAN